MWRINHVLLEVGSKSWELGKVLTLCGLVPTPLEDVNVAKTSLSSLRFAEFASAQ